MKISQNLSTETIRTLTPDELQLGTRIFTTNLQFTPHDTVLIITDATMLQKEAAIWHETAKALHLPVELVILEGMTHSGEEPPEEIVEKARLATINIFQTSYSLTHTLVGKSAIKNRGRGISLPGADYELLMRTLKIDYIPVKNLGEQLKTRLSKNETIHISSEAGTNLTAKIRQTAVINDAGFFPPGELGNLPAGEVFFAPVLGSTHGTLVIDGSIADDVLDAPILITIEVGVAVKMEGGVAAQNLWKKLDAFGKAGRTVAEIGIGTNPAAQIVENLLEAEKAYGTVHVAFGNSSAIGGENNVPIHIDGLVALPEVSINNAVILKNTEFLL